MYRFLLGVICLAASLSLGLPAVRDRFPPVQIEAREAQVRLYLHATGEIIELPLEEYLVGVVAAEMPASFPQEALKAQAVAARTYIVRRMAQGAGGSQHPGADVCDDPRHGQAWISREEMRSRWGPLGYYQHYYKVRRAVEETRGMVITYRGQLIDPVYHASCGGRGTEDAAAVWAADVPYLKGVPCPFCADPEPERTVFLSLDEVSRALGAEVKAVPVAGGGSPDLLPVVERTPAGRPRFVRLGDRVLPATAVREKLNLRSADFRFALKNGRVEVTTRGYGHAVGMCQYGARGLAEHGYTFEQIIKHYYTGVEVTKME